MVVMTVGFKQGKSWQQSQMCTSEGWNWPIVAHYLTGSSPRCTLFLRPLSFYCITKPARKYLSQIFNDFNNQISQHTIYSLNCVLVYFYLFTIHSFVGKSMPVSFFKFFYFSIISIFIFTSQKSSRCVGKSLCRPLSNRGTTKNNLSSVIFSFYKKKSEFSSKPHNSNIWQKIILWVSFLQFGCRYGYGNIAFLYLKTLWATTMEMYIKMLW